MKPAPFKYHRAASLADATALISNLDNARLLAGGQSLMPMMNMRYVMVDHLVDLNQVTELAGIRMSGGRASIGAMTRQRDILASPDLLSVAPIFAEALQQVGHIQTRNRGTIGGSLSHLDPAAELPGLAALHDATVTLSKSGSSREIAIKDFAFGYMTPCTEPDEILSEISFDTWPSGHGYDFREFAQRHGDFAITGVGTLIALDGAKRIERVACVLIGVDYQPIRLTDIEQDLIGQTPSEDLFRAAGEKARERDMMEDALVPESYRKQLAAVLLRRSLTSAASRAAGQSE
jgi:carbon-monoxide dehydrogenase medium subunit